MVTPHNTRGPLVGTWTIGDATVTRLEEQLGYASLPPEKFIDGLDREFLARHLDWLVPHHYSVEDHRLITSIHSWLIRTGRHTILLDCCAGNHKDRPGFARFHQLDTPFLQRLRAAGVQPEEIDIVLCTHLHADHVGWNTRLVDGRWVPTFPNAKYLFSRVENEIGDPRRSPAAEADLLRRNAYRDSVLPVIEAGQAVLVEGDHAIDDSLTIVPAPGHTPGHVALWLRNAAGRALFCGDAIHHALQMHAPHWNSGFCELPDVARTTRRRILESCVEHRAPLFPGHFGAPHVARVVAAGSAFAADFVAPERD